MRISYSPEQLQVVLNEFDAHPVQIFESRRGGAILADSRYYGRIIVKIADLNNRETEDDLEPPRSRGIKNESLILESLPKEIGPDLVGARLNDTGVVYLAQSYVEGSQYTHKHHPARVYASRLANVLEKLHGSGVVHGDIQPDTVIVPRLGSARLLDFELAHYDDSREQHSGLYHFGSPESAARVLETGLSESSFQEDVYRLASSIYAMHMGVDRPVEYPDNAVTMEDRLEVIAGRRGLIPPTVHVAATGLLYEILRQSAAERPTTVRGLMSALGDS